MGLKLSARAFALGRFSHPDVGLTIMRCRARAENVLRIDSAEVISPVM